MAEIILIVLHVFKVFAITVAVCAAVCAILMTLDLLMAEYKIYQSKWPTQPVPTENNIRRHRATRAQKVQMARDEESWASYFFVDLSRKNISEKDPFAHPYIVSHKKLHKHVFALELSHV